MPYRPPQPISGHVVRREGKRGARLVREVPAPGRPPGQMADRPGMDDTRTAGRRVLDESGHQTPHFHAAYAGDRASLDLDGRVLAGSLPPRALKLVRRWASLH